MKQEKDRSSLHRRRLLKALASGGAVVTARGLPSHWREPAIDSVMLPAHAQTSGNNFFGSQSIQITSAPRPDDGTRLAKLLDGVIPKAEAVMPPLGIFIEIAVVITGNGTYTFYLKYTEVFPCIGSSPDTSESSSYFTGSASAGLTVGAVGTRCDGMVALAALTVQFPKGFVRAFGDVNGYNFDIDLDPGTNIPVATPCIDCPPSEEESL